MHVQQALSVVREAVKREKSTAKCIYVTFYVGICYFSDTPGPGRAPGHSYCGLSKIAWATAVISYI